MSEVDPTDLLAREYALLLGNHENIAARAVTIKAWSVTVGTAGLGLAYSSGQRSALLFAAFAAGIFWLVEALNRGHQGAYEPRIAALELYFREGTPRPPPFQVFGAWEAGFWERGRFWRFVRRACYLHVMLPHVIIVVGGAALFALSVFCAATFTSFLPHPSPR